MPVLLLMSVMSPREPQGRIVGLAKVLRATCDQEKWSDPISVEASITTPLAAPC